MFDHDKVRFTSAQCLAEDILKLSHRRSDILLGYLGIDSLVELNGALHRDAGVSTAPNWDGWRRRASLSISAAVTQSGPALGVYTLVLKHKRRIFLGLCITCTSTSSRTTWWIMSISPLVSSSCGINSAHWTWRTLWLSIVETVHLTHGTCWGIMMFVVELENMSRRSVNAVHLFVLYLGRCILVKKTQNKTKKPPKENTIIPNGLGNWWINIDWRIIS